MKAVLLLAGLLVGASCARDESAPAPRNVLVVLLDDVGCDVVSTYGEHPTAPATPTLDRLAREGVLFRNAYAQPLCSPTRASLLTGRYAFRTGVGRVLGDKRVQWDLQDDELTIPEVVKSARSDVTCAAVGKWHLSSIGTDVLDSPRRHGFDSFAGAWENLRAGQSYYSYDKIENGSVHRSSTYATTEQVDDALSAIRAARGPWFVYLAFTAAHTPWQSPPRELALTAGPDDRDRYEAMVRAMDRELGRLLDSLDPQVRARTTVIVLGDNGTPAELLQPPSRPGRGKGTLFEGGVRVPLIVAGAGVRDPGREVSSIVHVVDILPTTAELLGIDLSKPPARERTIDGVSLAGLLADATAAAPHEYVLCEYFWPNGHGPYDGEIHAIRDARFKLIAESGAADQLFDLRDRRFEGRNLLARPDLEPAARDAYERLRAELARLLQSR